MVMDIPLVYVGSEDKLFYTHSYTHREVIFHENINSSLYSGRYVDGNGNQDGQN